jgi:hypothetical protein
MWCILFKFRKYLNCETLEMLNICMYTIFNVIENI